MQQSNAPARLIWPAFFLLSIVSVAVHAQKPDSLKPVNTFSAAATVTNNGVSLLPTFSLGKPAMMFDLNVGRRLTFEPQLRFSLQGKPWVFLFWWRYKIVRTEKFRLNVGAHPAFSFKSIPAANGTDQLLTAQEYLAGEIVPNYFITKNISIGLYYLQSHGFKGASTITTQFLTINANFSRIPVTKDIYFKFQPQVFVLRMDDKHGYYTSATITLMSQKLPLSIQSIVNKAIDTAIPSKDFIWNLSLIYAYNNQYVRR